MTNKFNELNKKVISSIQNCSYEPDDVHLTSVQIERIKRLSGTPQDMEMTSSLFNLNPETDMLAK